MWCFPGAGGVAGAGEAASPGAVPELLGRGQVDSHTGGHRRRGQPAVGLGLRERGGRGEAGLAGRCGLGGAAWQALRGHELEASSGTEESGVGAPVGTPKCSKLPPAPSSSCGFWCLAWADVYWVRLLALLFHPPITSGNLLCPSASHFFICKIGRELFLTS